MNTPPKNMKEQLSPIATKLRENRSIVRPVSQITLRLRPIDGKDRFSSTVDEILRWMNRRAGQTLPQVAWDRGSFELSDIGAQRTAAVALQEPMYWAARLDDADKNVPLRTWVTEIGVGIDKSGSTLFGARLICTTRGEDEPFERTVPSFVKAIISSGSAELDGVLLGKDLRVLASLEDVHELVGILEDPRRLSDVIVFALPETSTNPNETAANAIAVHTKLLGIAHVFVLTGSASFYLTDAVGKDLSVFKQAVRTYRPGFRAWVDQPSNHPLALPSRIATWNSKTSKEFESWLINQTLANSVHTPGREDRLPSFNYVRQISALAERTKLKSAGGSDAELAKLYALDNEQLRTELREQKDLYDGLLASAEAERESAVQEANAAKAQAIERLHRIRSLESRFAEVGGKAETPIPVSLSGFEGWCREHLIGAVELANRAFQGVRRSEYHDPQLIYRSLVMLRDYYVPMRLDGTQENRQAYLDALAKLQLEESLTGDGINFAAEQYTVQYGGRRRALDRHLKSGNSRDRKYCFRLYFFWDEDDQIVVVGWLPSHLENRAS